MGYGILVPWPGIEPTPPAMEAWSVKHWSTKEVPTSQHFRSCPSSGDLPDSGIEPSFPTLAGRLFTAEALGGQYPAWSFIHHFARCYCWGKGKGYMRPPFIISYNCRCNLQWHQNKDFDFLKLHISGEKILTSLPTRSSLFSTMPQGAIPIAQTRPLDLEEWSFKASPTWLMTPVSSRKS